MIMLVAFIALAVPLTVAALQTAAQLSRNSGVYDDRLTALYSAASGIEVALWEMLSDPGYGEDLTEASPTKTTQAQVNNETVDVTVTRIFGEQVLQGQGLVVTKSVDPNAVPANATTTFTYTLTIKNEGTGTARIKRLTDYLPPGLSYLTGSTSGLTTQEPTINNGQATCGSSPYELRWNVQPEDVTIASGQQLSFVFQATGTLADGTYYNQASARYDPWWVSPDVFVYTPFSAEITVGSGTPKCGHNLQLLVTQSVDPPASTPGVQTVFTYTVSIEDVSPDVRYVCKIENLLPPSFVYDPGSTGDYPGNIWPLEPIVTWESGSERWNLRWSDGADNSLEPLSSLSAGETETQVFRAVATPESGVDYYSEVSVTWSSELTGGGKCKTGQNDGGTAYGGTGDLATVDTPTTFDVAAVATNGTVKSRVVIYRVAGDVEILSWQAY